MFGIIELFNQSQTTKYRTANICLRNSIGMKHFSAHSSRLCKVICNDSNNDGASSTLQITSGDESTASSEEQTDILDFFVKDKDCAVAETSVINLSDDEDVIEKVSQKKGIMTNNSNFTARRRGRPRKNSVSNRNLMANNNKNHSTVTNCCESNNFGRTKPNYKAQLQNLNLTTTRSLNCAIKFGEPIGIPKRTENNEKGLKRNHDQDTNVAVLNRPKRTAYQKLNTSCSTDEENVDMSWQEMRDLEKALAASLKNKSSSLDSNSGDVLAQRKFVQAVSLPKKRGRKRKEPSNILVCEKAYTEDFINFLCVRSSIGKPSLPTSKDLLMNSVFDGLLPNGDNFYIDKTST